MTHLKKSLALLLALAMIFSSMSVAASGFDATVDGGFELGFTVKFFRNTGTDETPKWEETNRAKPGEDVKARVYISTEFLTNTANMALLFDSKFLDNPKFTDGVSRALTTNAGYREGALGLFCNNAVWYENETNYSQNYITEACPNGILVDMKVIEPTYFNDFDLVSNTLQFSSNNTILTDDDWVIEYDLKVVDDAYTRTVNTTGTARVPKELAATTTSPKPMFISFPKGASAENKKVTNMYKWNANITTVEGKLTTTSNIILNANGGYYLVNGEPELTSELPGIIGEKVLGLGSAASPSLENYIHYGWSKVPVPADRKIDSVVAKELELTEAQIEEVGGILTDAMVDELTLSPTEIAALEYDYDDQTLYAVWAPTTENDVYYTYEIYYMLLDGTYSKTADYSQQILAETGSEIALTEIPVEGFHIDKNETEDDQATIEGSDSSIIVKGDKSSVLKAYYARNKYTVTYNYEDNAGAGTQADTVLYGDTVPEFTDLPNGPSKEGYTFKGWETKEGDPAPSTVPAKDIELFPVFEINTYTYVFDATQGGEFSDGNRTKSHIYTYGETPAFPAEEPTFPGKTFIGWSADLPDEVECDMEFVAEYNDVEYEIIFMDGANQVGDTFYLYYGDTVYEGDVPFGYNALNSWTLADKTVVSFPYTVTGDTIFYAVDEADVHNADFYVDGELYESVPTVFDEEIIAPDAPKKEGYTFVMWDPEVGLMDDYGKRYDAIFEINNTTISFNTGVSTIVIDPISGDYGDPVDSSNVPATLTRPGYTFKGWDASIPKTMPAEDMTINAIWEKNTYTVRFVDYDGSLVDIVKDLYESENKAPALPSEYGYTYSGWTYTDSEGATQTIAPDADFVMPAADITAKATRVGNEYSIKFTDKDGNDLGIDDIVANCGDEIDEPAEAPKGEAGKTFEGWALASDPDKVIDFPETMPADGLELVPVWSTNEHRVIFDAKGGSFADGKSSYIIDSVKYGEDLTKLLPANPTKGGYIFDKWNPVPATMLDEDMTFEAIWTPDPSGKVEYTINAVTINPADGKELTQTVVTNYAAAGETVEVIKSGAAETADHTYYIENLIASESNVPDDAKNTNTKITIAADGTNVITVYYKLKTVTVKFYANGGEFSDKTSVATATGNYGEAINAPVPTRTGYEFKGWDKTVDATFTSDASYVAQWEAEKHYAIFNINGEEYAKVEYAYGDKISAPDYTPATGEDFSGWDVNANTVMGTKDIVFDATSTDIEYKLTYNLTSAPAGASAPAGTKGTYKSTVKVAEADEIKGYTFDGWYYDNTKYEANADFEMPAEDVVLTGSYTAIEYDVDFVDDNKVVDTEKAVVGEIITLPKLDDKDGFIFKGWKYDQVTYGPGASFTMPAEEVEFEAVWEAVDPSSYTVSYKFDTTAPATAVAPSSQTFVAGADVTVKAVAPVNGYEFLGWTYNGTTYRPGESFTMPAGNVELVGSWIAIIPDSYKVSYEYKGEYPANVPALPDDATVVVGEDVTVAAVPTLDGYTFGGWYYNGVLYDGVNATTFEMPNHDVTIVGTWTKNVPDSYTVSYSYAGVVPEGAADKLPDSSTVKVGDDVTVAAKPTGITGYTFDGWYYNGKIITEFEMPAANVTLTGLWVADEPAPEKFTVSYEYKGDVPENATALPVDAEVEEGATVTVAAVPAEVDGYTFNGWYYNGKIYDGTGDNTFAMPNHDVTIIGRWTKDEVPVVEYDLTFDENGGSAVTDMKLEAGEKITLPASSKDGHTFSGWLYNGTVYPAGSEFTMPAEAAELVASWTKNPVAKHTLSYEYKGDVPANATALPADAEIEEGATVTVADVPAEVDGYVFSGWYYNGDKYDGTGENSFTMPNHDVTIVGTWTKAEADEYSLTYSYTGDTPDNAPAIPEADVVAAGETVTVAAKPADVKGYTFDGWYYEDEIVTSFTMPEKHVTIIGKWTVNEYSITLDADGGEFANGEGQFTDDVPFGGDITLPADPTRDGYTLSHWVDNEGNRYEVGELPTKMEDAKDLTFTAVWTENDAEEHTITYYLVKGEGAQAEEFDSETYAEGETMTHPTPDVTGFTFNGWVDADGNAIGNVMGDSDIEAYAHLTINSYKVTYLYEEGGDVYKEYEDVVFGSEIPKPEAPTKDGYIFAGWSPVVAGTMPAKDVTYTATWVSDSVQPGTYKAEYLVDGEIHGFYYLAEGEAMKQPEDPQKFGYKFVGWEPSVPETMPGHDMTFEAKFELDEKFVGIVIGGTVVSGAVIGTVIGINTAIIAGATIIGGIIILGGITELVKKTHTVTYMVDGEVYKTYKVVEGTTIPVPADPEKDGADFKGWNPDVPEKMGSEDLVFEATWDDINVAIPDTGSAAGIAAFAAISGAAAAAYVITRRKKEEE